MYARVFPNVTKMLYLELTRYLKKSESLPFQHLGHRLLRGLQSISLFG